MNASFQCDWAAKAGLELIYVLCTADTHYCGGTEGGAAFLMKNQNIPDPLSFLTSVRSCKLIPI